MGSADFSQFAVTTANETACETSALKVHALSPHLPATSTGTSSNFWTSSLLADLSVFPSLICGSCPSGQGLAYSFLQIPSHGGHPCCSAMYFVVAYVYSGLPPVRARPWRANQKHHDPWDHGVSSFSENELICSSSPSLHYTRPYRCRRMRASARTRAAMSRPRVKCAPAHPESR